MDNELIEFYKWLSERAIIDDSCRGEGEAECAVKLYNKSKVENLNIQRVVFSEERAEVCDCDDRKPHLDSGDGMIYCLNCTKDIKQT